MSTSTFDVLVYFWRTVDENGSMAWTIRGNELSYIDLQKMIDLLNFLSEDYHLKSTLQNARVEL